MTKLNLRIAAITPLTDRISTYTLTAANDGPLPAWDAGAHIRVDVPGGDRAYSLIRFDTGADGGTWQIAVQREDTGAGGSRHIHGLAVGDTVTATAPKCDFPVVPDAPALLLAGGIGITPMISMAAELAARDVAFGLHYAGRSRDVMAFADDLATRFGTALHLHCDDDTSALDLPTLIGGLGDRHLYICGPKGLIDAARSLAENAGIAPTCVHVELFDNSTVPAGNTAFEVEIVSTGQVFTVAPDQTIIEALEQGGIDLIYDCQRGDCGICQTTVISGTPDHRDVVLTDAEKASGTVMQICVSRATSARLVLDL